jgi:endoglucanase
MTAVTVSGNRLLDAQGQPLQLRGVNISGLEFFPIDNATPVLTNIPYWGPGQNPNLQSIAAWGANAIRLPLNEQSYLGQTCTDANGTTKLLADPAGKYRTVVKSIVDAATALGMCVILDLHKNTANATINGVVVTPLSNTSGQSEMADRDNSIAFWTAVATAFKGNPAVIFDLFNEPHIDNFDNPTVITPNPGTSLPAGLNPEASWAWAVWRDGGTGKLIYGDNETFSQPYASAGMQAMVNAVRATGATNVILAGGISWAQDSSLWLQFKPTDPAGQLACSWHAYPSQSDPSYPSFPPGTWWSLPTGAYDWIQTILAAGFPVVIGETGNGVSGQLLPKLLPWADQHHVSVFAWSWNPGWGSLVSDQNGTPVGDGPAYKAWLQSHSGGIGVANQFTKLTLTTLPSTRTDGSAVTAADLGSANIYKNGAKYATLNAPVTVGETWTDTVAAVSGDKYTVSINDTQTPPVEGGQSVAYVVGTITTVKPPLSVPTIAGVTA